MLILPELPSPMEVQRTNTATEKNVALMASTIPDRPIPIYSIYIYINNISIIFQNLKYAQYLMNSKCLLLRCGEHFFPNKTHIFSVHEQHLPSRRSRAGSLPHQICQIHSLVKLLPAISNCTFLYKRVFYLIAFITELCEISRCCY